MLNVVTSLQQRLDDLVGPTHECSGAFVFQRFRKLALQRERPSLRDPISVMTESGTFASAASRLTVMRTDLFDRRRGLMQLRAGYVSQRDPAGCVLGLTAMTAAREHYRDDAIMRNPLPGRRQCQ